MLTCITCSKQSKDDGAEDDSPVGSSKDVKSLTTQLKDMALKVSGSHKGKPNQTDGNFKKGHPDFDTVSEGVPYPYVQQPGSSSSTPAWDFSHNRTPRPDHSRFTGLNGDRTPRGAMPSQLGEVALGNEDEPKEWIAQVEPGVQITFVSLPRGGNDLKRIRFSREMFNKWQAQSWWGENYDRIMELYNVQRFNQQALNGTPGRSEDGRESNYSRLGSERESPRMTPSMRYNFPSSTNNNQQNYYNGPMEAARTTTSSSVSMSNASDIVESEWIEEDEPGVYITIRQLIDGTRELRRVRFSREKFGEVHAKLWWETNRDRIQVQYLS